MNQPTPVRPTIHSTLNTRHAPPARFPICRLIALLWLGLLFVTSAHALNIVQYVEVSGVPGQDGVIRVTIGPNTLEVPIPKDATCEQICQAIKDKIAERDTPDFWKGLKIDCLCSAGSSLIGFRSGDGTDLGKPKIKTEGKDDLGNPTGREIPGVSIDPTEIDNALIKISNITGPPLPSSGNGTNRWTNCIVVVINGLTNEICVVVDDDISGDDAGEYPSTADEIIAEFLKRIEAHPDLGAVRDAEGQVFVTLGGPTIKILRFGSAKFPYAGPDNQPYPEPLLRSVNPGTGGLEGTYWITLHCSSMGPNATVLFNGLPLPALAYDPELDTYTVQVPPSPFAGPVEIAVLPPGTDSNRHNTIKEGFVYQSSLPRYDFAAHGLSLAPIGNGLYQATPQVEISLSSAATNPVPLDFAILVNGVLRHDRRAAHMVNAYVICEDPGCSGRCSVQVDGIEVEGHCYEQRDDCLCSARANLASVVPVWLVLAPGDTVQLVLDPDQLIAELSETNNTMVTVVPVLPDAQYDFAAQGLDLRSLENGIYEVRVQAGITVGSGATLPAPLDFVVLVNGALRYDGRGTEAVTLWSPCDDMENCSGGCWVAVNGRRKQGTCQGAARNCGCKVTDDLATLQMALLPGDVVQVVLDPDNRVIEPDETDNNFTVTVQPATSGYDFVALGLELIREPNAGLYQVTPRIGMRVGSNAIHPQPLSFVVNVNGESRYETRTTVDMVHSCPSENCAGGCIGSIGGKAFSGYCDNGCGCVPTNGLESFSLVLAPGDAIQFVLDPENHVPEFNEANNTITVVVPNRPPVLGSLPNQAVHAGTVIQFQIPAVDPDGWAQALTYALEGAPDGASIDPATGEFQWHATAAHIGTSNLVVVRVTDSSQPPLSDVRDFLISVAPPPIIVSCSLTNDSLQLAWTSVPGNTYRIEATRDLLSGAWTEQVGNLSAQDSVASWSLPRANALAHSFYRIGVVAAVGAPVNAAANSVTNTPAWTCCERDIQFPKTVKIDTSASTGTTNNDTRRFVIVDVKVPLEYRCADVDNQKCIADLAVKVVFRARQADGGAEYTGEPEEEIVETIQKPNPPDCDNKKHDTEVIIRWRGTYKTRRDIKGTLNLELSVPGAKGSVDHSLSVNVASASSPKAEKPVLKKRE